MSDAFLRSTSVLRKALWNKIRLHMGTEVGDSSLFKALAELCLNRTVHPSISLSHHRCCWNKSVGDACMHDDRLCEERKKRCFRADLTVIPPSPVLLFAIKAEVARWKKCDPLDCAPTPSTLAQSRERKGSKFAA